MKNNYLNLNDELARRYQEYLDLIQGNPAMSCNEYSYPLLMNVFPQYSQVSLKILFVGKETFGWLGTMDNQENLRVEYLMNGYKNFEFANGCNNYNSPFWRFIRTFHGLLNKDEYPMGFLWTNVSKHDANKTTPDKRQRLILTDGFFLLKDEIAIVKPDVVLFMAGWTYDQEIADVFKGIKYISLIENSVYQCSHPNLPFHSYTFRHPNYLQRAKIFHSTLEYIYKKVMIHN